jgi:hypothetical protein
MKEEISEVNIDKKLHPLMEHYYNGADSKLKINE